MKKLILLAIPVLLLTGCVSVKIIDENSCYRYVDYKGEENYMNSDINTCYTNRGAMFCKENGRKFQVFEYELTKCPIEVEE